MITVAIYIVIVLSVQPVEGLVSPLATGIVSAAVMNAGRYQLESRYPAQYLTGQCRPSGTEP